MNLAARTTRYLLRKGHLLTDSALPAPARARRRAAMLTAVARTSFTSVTFVCQGNINRSAFAEHGFRTLRGEQGPAARSCGLHLRGDRPSPPLSIAAASQLGIDLSAHRSQVASQLSGSGTLLIGFEPHHLQAWRGATNRESVAVLLGAFADDPVSRLLIPDPYGHELPFIASVFEHVLECVRGLSARLERVESGEWRIRA